MNKETLVKNGDISLKRRYVTIEYAILIAVIFWTVMIIVFSPYIPPNDLIMGSIFFGSFFSGLVAFNAILNPGKLNFFRVITGGTEIFFGFLVLVINFNIEFEIATIFLLLGTELIGIALAAYFKERSIRETASMRRPDAITTEPEPEPRPMR